MWLADFFYGCYFRSLESKSAVFNGLIIALVTPVNNNRVDEDTLRALVKW